MNGTHAQQWSQAICEELEQIEKNEMGVYQMKNNLRSLDGLPGLKTARRDAGERFWIEDAMAKVSSIVSQREALISGIVIGALISFLITFLSGLLLT